VRRTRQQSRATWGLGRQNGRRRTSGARSTTRRRSAWATAAGAAREQRPAANQPKSADRRFTPVTWCFVTWWDCANQNRRFDDAGGGCFRIVNQHSGKCLDVYQSDTGDGADIQQWTCGTGNNQQRTRAAS
jgi:hypothetical protein